VNDKVTGDNASGDSAASNVRAIVLWIKEGFDSFWEKTKLKGGIRLVLKQAKKGESSNQAQKMADDEAAKLKEFVNFLCQGLSSFVLGGPVSAASEVVMGEGEGNH
jgi:hypothetical protein